VWKADHYDRNISSSQLFANLYQTRLYFKQGEVPPEDIISTYANQGKVSSRHYGGS
jgi:hypothetical protein